MNLKSTSDTRPAPASPRSPGFLWLLAALLGLATVALYWPVTHDDFVVYDDDRYVQANPTVQAGLNSENFKWAFTHTVSGNWHPVTMLSHMLDCQLYGLKPWGHHLTSLFFHAADTVLLLLLLHRLTGALWRSAWVAAMFAFHPLHVESVAWIAERKDVLSTFFGFLALLFYARYAMAKKVATAPESSFFRSRDYWLACLFFALGLMSKPMLVTWPCVLLLLDYWPLDRFKPGQIRSLLLEKIPFFLLTVAASIATYLIQKTEGAVEALANLTLTMRVENGLISYCRYALKLIWPADLAVFYPYPPHWPLPWVLLSAASLIGISALVWLGRRRLPFSLTGWLCFLGTLVPVIGLVQVGSQSMADRYTYIPSVGIFIMISWGAYELTRRWQQQALMLSVVGSIALILCFGLARHQIGYWVDSETLFRHTLAITTENEAAHNALGVVYHQQKNIPAAVHELQEAIRINPHSAQSHRNLGVLYDELGQTNLALNELRLAVQSNPSWSFIRYCLACYLLKDGQTDDAIDQYKQSASFKPNDPESCLALVKWLVDANQTDAALIQLQQAAKANPSNAPIHYGLGNLLLNQGHTDNAIAEFQETIRLDPDFFEAHNNLGSLLSKSGQFDQAIVELKESIRLKPDLADVHYNLGALYLKKGLNAEAIAEFQTAIRLSPDLAAAHYYLGIVLMKQAQPDAAAVQFHEAIRLMPDDAPSYNKLGIALGSLGHLPEAIDEFKTAVRLKPDYAEANTNLAIALKMQGAANH